jgi:Raf kinase inhibitor-like YbhB/YbcL family protein
MGCSSSGGADHPQSSVTAPTSITVTSPDFADGAAIPKRFTCDGANVSPALHWSDVPAGAGAVALVVDDPDAPGGTFTHWVVVNIDPSTTSIDEGAAPADGQQAPNSDGKSSWFGPCPPSGTHHYRFTVYALAHRVENSAIASLDAALSAIAADAIAQGRLVGVYRRN